MATRGADRQADRLALRATIALALAGLLAGGCATSGDPGATALTPKDGATATTKSQTPDEAPAELERLAAAHKEDRRNLKTAIAYAQKLRAAGRKEQALGVLQHVGNYHANDRTLASEHGRLALELGQIGLASKLLEMADDPASPDWRVLNARGTIHAKQEQFKQAIAYYERALAVGGEQPSVLSNLALAYTAEGQADKAEPLLRRAASAGDDVRVRQNLALVLGLNGRFDEAQKVAAADLPPERASENVSIVRNMVGEARTQAAVAEAPTAAPVAATAPAVAGWRTDTRETPQLKPAQR